MWLYIYLGNRNLPTSVGGRSETCLDLYSQWPKFELDPLPYVTFYYMFILTHHTSSLIELLINLRGSSTFIEVMQHHILTLLLIGFSYYCNMWSFGLYVSFVHDISDIALCGGKVLRDLEYRYKSYILPTGFAGIIVSWTYFRVYCPLSCYIWSCMTLNFYIETWIAEENYEFWLGKREYMYVFKC